MTVRKYAALLAAVLALAASRAAAAPAAATVGIGKMRLAVLDFTLAGSAHPDLARVLSDGAARGAEGSEYVIVTQGEVAAVLGLDRLRQLLGCNDDRCMSETSRALDAERLLSGSLTILERTALLTVRLIDTREGRTLARASTSLLAATEKELVDAARRLSFEVITGKRLDTSGVIRIQVDRPGAVVTLDGKEIGQTPLTGSQRVLEGPHAVVVQKDGYVRWSTTVSVTAGGEVPVEAQLIPIKLLGEQARSRLWYGGYTVTGVAVLAAGSGIWFNKMAGDSYSKYKKASTRSDATRYHDEAQQRSTVAKISWGVAGVAAVSAGTMFILAMRADAKAAEAPKMAMVPTGNGVLVVGEF
jgi:hypothetical protein